uniref:Tr-type G domain-containing protein n=1 Tax=Timema shepardi TaxID=629360 RepID=A0A7R9AVV3_TIMSH|nr:unnamed protein product [Timema shepardi]
MSVLDSSEIKNLKCAEEIPVENIRNFSIIAHVDHGKSTLADRLLEMTGFISEKSGQNQMLDRLQVERERGITVKAQTASLNYRLDGKDYLLNLIDTPGHVDFSNEVSRSLAACQGVILLVDANEGVQAQTVANFYLAFYKELTIIPVLNKVDLKNADPERVKEQMKTLFDINPSDILQISAKLGTGVEDVFHAIVERIPPPPVDRSADFRALLFDSWYDRYRGAILLVYVTDGSVKVGNEITFVHSGKNYQIRTLGMLRPHEEPSKGLPALGQGWRLGFLGLLHLEVFNQRRGMQKGATNIDNQRVMLQFFLPLNEIVVDFHDHLKSISSGYASFDYEDYGYVPSNIVKGYQSVSWPKVSSTISSLRLYPHPSSHHAQGILSCEPSILLNTLEIAIQAAVGGKIIARETLKPFRKDVTAKLYGGDVTRKMKLLKQQAEGKKKMRMVANISLPRETFIDILKR